MTSRQANVAKLATLCVSAGLLAGCPCGPGTPLVAYHFEDDCADALCGFTVPSGQATRVATLAPGEHGLQLEANTEIVRSLSLPLAGAAETLVLGYVARCENGASLGLTVTVAETRASDAGLATPNIAARTAASAPVADWAHYETVVRNATTLGAIRSATVIELRVQTMGAGRCWVDEIEIDTLRYCG